MKNNKKWILLSLLALTATTIRPITVQLEEFGNYIGTTIITGAAVGTFTGYTIGYLSGTIFDKTIAQSIRLYFGEDYYTTLEAPIITISKIGTKLLCKYIWEKPLRNKIMHWITEDMKKDSIPHNEELMKTMACTTAYMTCLTV